MCRISHSTFTWYLVAGAPVPNTFLIGATFQCFALVIFQIQAFWSQDSPTCLLFKWGYCLFLMLAFIFVQCSESLVSLHTHTQEKKRTKTCIKMCLCVYSCMWTNPLWLEGHPAQFSLDFVVVFSPASKLSCETHGPAVAGWLRGRWRGYRESLASSRAGKYTDSKLMAPGSSTLRNAFSFSFFVLACQDTVPSISWHLWFSSSCSFISG